MIAPTMGQEYSASLLLSTRLCYIYSNAYEFSNKGMPKGTTKQKHHQQIRGTRNTNIGRGVGLRPGIRTRFYFTKNLKKIVSV